ncbi:hypothetical protein [Arthrobacter woluwensis]|uniref:hypothetical protein n=1 Tax=Arthrobacter woluwensis TaxID=156980 RepID=UPI00382AE379
MKLIRVRPVGGGEETTVSEEWLTRFPGEFEPVEDEPETAPEPEQPAPAKSPPAKAAKADAASTEQKEA